MIDRKDFLKRSLASIVGLASISSIAKTNEYNLSSMTKINEYDSLCEFFAEKYVDCCILGPFKNDNDETWFAASPVGYVYSPSDRNKKIIVKLPAAVRQIKADNYNVVVRKALITQIKDYFLETQIWKNF